MSKTQLIKDFLNYLSELEPNLSKELTKKTPKDLKGTQEGKIFKIKAVQEKHPEVFREISSKILNNDKNSFPELGYSNNSLLHSIFHLTKDEPVSGSFGQKYESNQSEIE